MVRHELLRDAAQLRVRQLRDRPGARAEVHQHRFLDVQADRPRRQRRSSCGWRSSTCSTRPTSRIRTIGSAMPTSVASAARGSPRARSSWARGSCSDQPGRGNVGQRRRRRRRRSCRDADACHCCVCEVSLPTSACPVPNQSFVIRHVNASLRGRVRPLACAVLSLAVMTSVRATTAASPQQAQGPADVRAPQRTDAGPATPGGGVRVFSWNLSSDAFVKDPAAFRGSFVSHEPISCCSTKCRHPRTRSRFAPSWPERRPMDRTSGTSTSAQVAGGSVA